MVKLRQNVAELLRHYEAQWHLFVEERGMRDLQRGLRNLRKATRVHHGTVLSHGLFTRADQLHETGRLVPRASHDIIVHRFGPHGFILLSYGLFFDALLSSPAGFPSA